MVLIFVLSYIGSLLATIHGVRPDVISSDRVPRGARPIALNHKQKSVKAISSSRFTLPAIWDSSIEPIGWFVIFKFALLTLEGGCLKCTVDLEPFGMLLQTRSSLGMARPSMHLKHLVS